MEVKYCNGAFKKTQVSIVDLNIYKGSRHNNVPISSAFTELTTRLIPPTTKTGKGKLFFSLTFT